MDEELSLFLADVDEQIDLLEEQMVSLEERDDPQTIHTILRAAHTLKGISATFGAQKMNALTHQLESILQKVRDDGKIISKSLVTALLSSVDILKTLRADIEQQKESKVDVKKIISQLKKLGEEGRAEERKKEEPVKEMVLTGEERLFLIGETEKGKRALQIFIRLKPDTLMPGARLLLIFQELKDFGQIIKMEPPEETLSHAASLLFLTESKNETLEQVFSSYEVIEEADILELLLERREDIQTAGGELEELVSESVSLKGKKTIRLDVERVEALMNITSELVIEKNRFLQVAQTLSGNHEDEKEFKPLFETRDQMDRKISLLQDEMLKVRMVPLDVLFKKLPRTVRDSALKAGKNVCFTMEGSSVELDKTVVDELSDPLIHILRNAVDHGIREKGDIHLRARQSEGNVVIEISDNGQGIDTEKVRQKALEKKMVSEEAVKDFSQKELLNLIFMPGFSTKEYVTETSGRGVGLDIVKSNLQKIQGSIDVETKPGSGATFIMKIPLTLAIIKALLVLAEGHKFAIPLSSVYEAVKVRKQEIQPVKKKETILLRGNVLPLFKLAELLELTSSIEEQNVRKVVIVSYMDRKIGFVIDTLLGEQEVVVYSLGKFIGTVPGISGATIDPEGRVALILDVPSLITSTLNI